MFSERRDMKTAKAFFRSAKTVTGRTPDRVTTDGHDSYPRAIRTELGKTVRHRTSRYLNNRIEQDHRGIKGRYRSMRGFKCPRSAARFCQGVRVLNLVDQRRNMRRFFSDDPAIFRQVPSQSVDALSALEHQHASRARKMTPLACETERIQAAWFW